MDNRLLAQMLRSSIADVRAAYIVCMADAKRRTRLAEERMQSNGFEHAEGSGWTSDGREIVRVAGQSWVMRKDLHEAAVKRSLEAAKRPQPEPETKSVVGTESLSQMTCPKCGDSLQHTAVCPKCAAGKLGYRHRYTCVCGGVDLISKEAL